MAGFAGGHSSHALTLQTISHLKGDQRRGKLPGGLGAKEEQAVLFDMKETGKHDIYNLLIGLVAPRPIAWVTTFNEDGSINAAPYSAFNYLSIDPPVLGFGVADRPEGDPNPKDTARNIRRTGEFVVNVVTEDLLHLMSLCATPFPENVSELEMVGLHTAASSVVGVPRIAEAHAAMECREHEIISVGRTRIVLGEVVAMYVEDRFVDPKGPYILAEDLHAVGRMNGQGAYVRTRDAFLHEPRLSFEEWLKGKR